MRHGSDDTLLLRCASSAQLALRNEVTTFRDCGARNQVIFSFRDAVRWKIIPSPRLLAAGGAITRTGGYCWFFGTEVDSPDEMRKAIRNLVRADADFIKIMVTSGIAFGPSNSISGLLYDDLESMRIAKEEATNYDRLIAAHCLGTGGIRNSVEVGVRTIEHCAFYRTSLRRAAYQPDIARAIADEGIYVDPSNAYCYCLGLEARRGHGRHNHKLYELSQIRVEWARTARSLRDLGVRSIPGSDGGWYGQPFGEFWLMPKLFVEEIGMSPGEALTACTRTAAEAIGLGAEIGTIEVGKRADLIALDGDPTVDIEAARRVRFTVVDGAVLFQDSVAGAQPVVHARH